MLEPLMLTKREAEVVTLLFEGKPQGAIAEELGTTRETVKTLLGRVFKKAGVHSETQLLALAWHNGGYLY